MVGLRSTDGSKEVLRGAVLFGVEHRFSVLRQDLDRHDLLPTQGHRLSGSSGQFVPAESTAIKLRPPHRGVVKLGVRLAPSYALPSQQRESRSLR